MTVHLSATGGTGGVAATYYAVDGGSWTEGAKIVIAAPANHSNDGAHTISFYSVDTVGTRETPRSVQVKIDTRPPGFSWKTVAPAVITSTQSVHCTFVVTEASGPVKVAWDVSDQYGSPAARKTGLVRDPGTRVVDVPPLYSNRNPFMPGLYKVRVTLTDAAGNVTVSAARPFRDYRPSQAKAWFKVSGAGKRVALTFDDGGNAAWASILGTLRAYHMHATFFPLGPYVDGALARRAVADGNAVGTHGWTHTQMTRQSYAQVQSEWRRGEAAYWSKAGVSAAPYCRPPYGSFNSTTLAAAGALGFTRVILWDVDPQDWASPGSSVIAQRVLSHVHSGAIVVMHLRAQTAAALPAILRGLKSRGYVAASLPEMFKAAGYR